MAKQKEKKPPVLEPEVSEQAENVVETAAEESPETPETPVVEEAVEEKAPPAPVKEKAKKADITIQVTEAVDSPKAELHEQGAKLVRVKFLKDYTFNTGTTKHSFKQNSIGRVEPHIANTLSARKICYILSV